MSWAKHAACKDQDPEMFFPYRHPGMSSPAEEAAYWGDIQQAKETCERCPVRQECLDWALSKPERAGIWGGATEEERHRLRRARARTELAFRRAREEMEREGAA